MFRPFLIISILLSFSAHIFSAETQHNNSVIKDNSPVSLRYIDTITQVSAQTSHNIPRYVALEHQQDILKRQLPLAIEIIAPFKNSPNGLLLNHSFAAPKESFIADLLYKKAQQSQLKHPYPAGSFVQKGFIYICFWWTLQCDKDDKRLKKLWNFMEAVDKAGDLDALKNVCINGIDNSDYNFLPTESNDDWTHNQMRNRRISLVGDYLMKHKNLSPLQAYDCLPPSKQAPLPLPTLRTCCIRLEDETELSLKITNQVISEEKWILIKNKLQEIKQIIQSDTKNNTTT